jgi:hypothetical protein
LIGTRCNFQTVLSMLNTKSRWQSWRMILSLWRNASTMVCEISLRLS